MRERLCDLMLLLASILENGWGKPQEASRREGPS